MILLAETFVCCLQVFDGSRTDILWLSDGKPVEEKLPFSYMNESVYKRKGPLEIRHFGSFYILLKSQ